MSNNAIQFTADQLAQLGMKTVKPTARREAPKPVEMKAFTSDTWVLHKHPEKGRKVMVLVHATPDNPFHAGQSGIKHLEPINQDYSKFEGTPDNGFKPNAFTQVDTTITRRVDWDKQDRIGLGGGKQKLSAKQARNQSKKGKNGK